MHVGRPNGGRNRTPEMRHHPPSAEEVDHAAPTEVQAFREAGRRATETYPGPVGEFIAQELETAAGFGFRFGTNALLTRLADHLLGTQPADATVMSPSFQVRSK